eukprot:SAG11_NODE_1426_length_4943_cov_7.372419_1_plen_112_part_00
MHDWYELLAVVTNGHQNNTNTRQTHNITQPRFDVFAAIELRCQILLHSCTIERLRDVDRRLTLKSDFIVLQKSQTFPKNIFALVLNVVVLARQIFKVSYHRIIRSKTVPST